MSNKSGANVAALSPTALSATTPRSSPALLDHGQNTGNKEWTDKIKSASPVAWQHINFFGRYEFAKQSAAIDMEQMIRELAKQVSE